MTGVTLRRARPDEASVLTELALAANGFWGQAFLDSCRAELSFSPDDIARRHVVVAELEVPQAGRRAHRRDSIGVGPWPGAATDASEGCGSRVVAARRAVPVAAGEGRSRRHQATFHVSG